MRCSKVSQIFQRGDRFGAFNEKGEFVSANDIIALLSKHLKQKGLNGILAKTVGASSLLNLYAEKNGLDVLETPVGFKWLGSAMRNNDVLIAGEESGGLTVRGHIPEKDGFIAVSTLLDLIATEGKPIGEILDDVNQKIGGEWSTRCINMKFDSDDDCGTFIGTVDYFAKPLESRS